MVIDMFLRGLFAGIISTCLVWLFGLMLVVLGDDEEGKK